MDKLLLTDEELTRLWVDNPYHYGLAVAKAQLNICEKVLVEKDAEIASLKGQIDGIQTFFTGW